MLSFCVCRKNFTRCNRQMNVKNMGYKKYEAKIHCWCVLYGRQCIYVAQAGTCWRVERDVPLLITRPTRGLNRGRLYFSGAKDQMVAQVKM
uniref:Uncharacterized protein n=1 Tax=Octopus bimaculoides TaxID=37653 RepID=A0A0L8G1U9_OCTBM